MSSATIENVYKWMDLYNQVVEFKKNYDKLPSQPSKDNNENKLASWYNYNKCNYKNNSGLMSIQVLKTAFNNI